ncbi:MAG: hypothetical protein Q8L14_13085 [Myxococcales bacterium]|nr:hypothetical protein [Myxococcales bacterium]
MKTSWERDEGFDQRARLELDPWEVRLLEGYHPLYDYSSTLVTTHAEWPESELRRRAIEVLSEDMVREADASVAGASSIEPFAKWKAADDLNAAAWARVPIEALVVDAQTPRAVRAEYGVHLTVEGVLFQWVGPATPRDPSCHLAPFDPPVRLDGLTAVAAVPGAFVFLRKHSPPYVTTREGRVLPAISEQLVALGVEASGFSRVFISGAALVGESALLRVHTQHHQRGASRATTGDNWWVRVDPRLGVVSRSR